MALLTEKSPLLLGSASPRRRDILTSLGIPFLARPVSVDETPLAGESPARYVERVVKLKRDALLERDAKGPFAGFLVADTTVVLGNTILGKPRDSDEALVMLERLAGRMHQVVSRYWLLALHDGTFTQRVRSVRTRVHMRGVPKSLLRAYAESGEGLDKAGAYAAQGLGTFLVERVEGSYLNVVGLPASELFADLMALGLLSQARPWRRE